MATEHTNRNRIWTLINGELVSHFRASEFEMTDGRVVIDARIPALLEMVRADIHIGSGNEAAIVVTNTCRTQDDLVRLAGEYGWQENGGRVSRDSKHLVKYGGIAVDIQAYYVESGEPVPIPYLAQVCRSWFDFVKPYDDHVHGDIRDGAEAFENERDLSYA